MMILWEFWSYVAFILTFLGPMSQFLDTISQNPHKGSKFHPETNKNQQKNLPIILKTTSIEESESTTKNKYTTLLIPTK